MTWVVVPSFAEQPLAPLLCSLLLNGRGTLITHGVMRFALFSMHMRTGHAAVSTACKAHHQGEASVQQHASAACSAAGDQLRWGDQVDGCGCVLTCSFGTRASDAKCVRGINDSSSRKPKGMHPRCCKTFASQPAPTATNHHAAATTHTVPSITACHAICCSEQFCDAAGCTAPNWQYNHDTPSSATHQCSTRL